MRSRILTLTLALLLGTQAVVAAQPAAQPPELPLEVFFGNPQITQLQISPGGRYLAMLQPANNRMNITVIDREKRTKQRITDMKEENVVSISWLNDSRLAFRQQYKGQESFGIYAVNADGTNLRILHQLTARDGENVWNTGKNSIGIIDTLPDDDEHILVGVYRGNSGLADVFKLNVNTEKRSRVLNNPGKVRDWVTDLNGVIRAAVWSDEREETVRILYRKNEKSDWETLDTVASDGPSWRPIGFAADNQTLYIGSNLGRSTTIIQTYDPVAKKVTGTVFADDTYDVDEESPLIYSQKRKKLIGVRYNGEKPSVHWLEPEDRKLQQSINAAIPGKLNVIVSRTRDESLAVIRSLSDRDPGSYYLLDVKSMELSELIQVNPLVKPEQMAEMRPISFKARDGLLLHGYITLPVGRERNAPLIVNPHGGPYGPRDSWGFNPEIQFLANRGFAVLQVNYRGSGGYGRDFEEAGYRQWGLKMQDDLTDGVKWAIEQGYAHKDRVGIYGASYGGYATLAGLVYTPELYQFGINYVGAADIARLGMIMSNFLDRPKPQQKALARRWLHPDLDKDQMRATSPVHFLERVRVPTLHAYGKYDPRVTIDHGEVLQQQLKKHGKTFKYIEIENEGHGFNKFENRIGFYKEMEAFLKERLAEMHKHPEVIIGPSRVIQMPVDLPKKTKSAD